MERLDQVLSDLAESTELMVKTVASLTDEDLRGPSRLPGWTRGHVVAHLARNADSVWNLLEWARTGVEVPQYPSNEARDAGVQASAGRPASELLREVQISVQRLDLQTRTMPDEAWDRTVRARSGWGHPAWYTLYRRWREVEAHHADINAGFGPGDWSTPYVVWELGDTLQAMRLDGWAEVARIRAEDMPVDVRLGDGGAEISAPGRELLAWLTGRDSNAAATLPAPPRWPLSPPDWRDL